MTTSLARSKAVATESPVMEALVFSVAGQLFGLPLLDIREVQRYTPPSPMPTSAKGYLGLMKVREEYVPLLDLTLALGFGSFNVTSTSIAVIAETNGKVLGLTVDDVVDVIKFFPGDERTTMLETKCVDRLFDTDGKLVQALNLELVVKALCP